MAKKKNRPVPAGLGIAGAPVALAAESKPASLWLWWLLLAGAVLLFFGPALFSPDTSIQWDAVDVHYSSQRYFAEEILAGRLPVWTPYVFSGFPFLADPQVGAFYPLNWPFMLAGAGPKTIQAEMALHSLLAMIGMFLLLQLWLDDRWAAAFGGIAYALSGFFAGHSSHVGIYQAACLLPLLIYFAERALRGPVIRWTAAAGLTAGLSILVGHFQTALYGCAALAVYVVIRAVRDRLLRKRGAILVAATAAFAFLVGAVLILPGLELTGLSIRAGQDFSKSSEGTLTVGSLVSLVAGDAQGARSGNYTGTGDRTQYYFYGGILLLPLAAWGLRQRTMAVVPAVLTLIAVWFMLGPGLGLSWVISNLIPWFRQVRAPIHAWFIAALGLSWLAAIGVMSLRRIGLSWVGPVACLVLVLDLSIFNSWGNVLTYARTSYETLYGSSAELLRTQVVPSVPAGTRLSLPIPQVTFGSLNSPLEVRVETTFGYNPLALRTYSDYINNSATNGRLLDGLAATRQVDPTTGAIAPRPGALAKAWFPTAVRQVKVGESLAALKTLDPASEALVTGATPSVARDAKVEQVSSTLREWTIRYQAPAGGLLAMSIPFYPGWSAESGGRGLPLLRLNHALTGVEVPAGSSEVRLRYSSNHLGLGAGLSLIGVATCLGGLALRSRRPGETSAAESPEFG